MTPPKHTTWTLSSTQPGSSPPSKIALGYMHTCDAYNYVSYIALYMWWVHPCNYLYTCIRSSLCSQAEEEEARQKAEREAKQKEKEARKQKRRELLGDDYVSEDEEEEEEEGSGEGGEGGEDQPPAEQEEKIKEPSSILSAFYSHDDERDYWVSMVSTSSCALYMYNCITVALVRWHDNF